MGLYKIAWKKSAEHELRKIDRQYIFKIVSTIESLAMDPLPVQSKKLVDSESSYRLRVGNYRVIYQVNSDKKIITVYHVRHRKDIYKRL